MTRNTLRLDTSGFSGLLRRLDELGGDVKQAVDDSLQQAGQQISKDTIKAIAKSNLPAQGKYSKGFTKKSVIKDANVEWNGSIASIPVGFDFSKPGAGGYLITGTPKMKPDQELHRMYKGKKYMSQIQSGIEDVIGKRIVERMLS